MVDLHLIFDGSGLILPITILVSGIAIYYSAYGVSKILDSLNKRPIKEKSIEKDRRVIELAKKPTKKPFKQKDKFDKVPKVIKDDLVDEKDKKRFGLF